MAQAEKCFYELLAGRKGAAHHRFNLLLYEILFEEKDKNMSFKDKVWEKFYLYVKKNIDLPLVLSDIAAKAGVSERYLSKIVRERASLSPKSFILKEKMRTATDMLRFTHLKIYEVANSLGFENQYYFSRIFKKYTSLTPSSLKAASKAED